ncbi:MAG: PAS domain-containing protein [Gammaproteobacteria bacterium]
MDLRRFRGTLSLKVRFSLAAGALVLLIATVLTAAAVLIAQRAIEDVVRERESALINQLARDLDAKIELRQNALLRLASDLAVYADQPTTYQARLEQYHALDGLFTNMSMVDAAGDQVANLDHPDARGRVNLSHRQHFIDTMRTGAPVISRPVMGEVVARPFVLMTAPIRASDGRIAFMLIGMIDLGRDSILKELVRSHSGKGSSFYLMSADGAFIAHPDERRLLQTVDVGSGDSPALRRVLDGDEVVVQEGGAGGPPALVSARRMASTGWIVATACPASESSAFVDQVKRNAVILALVLMLVIAPVVWLVIDRQLVPLNELGARMRARRWSPAEAYRDDEIGRLARTYDQLMEERQRADEALRESERNLRNMANNVPALVAYVDSARRFVFGNERYQCMFGVEASQLRGKTVREVVGEAVYAVTEPYVDAALRGESVRFERPIMRDGSLQWDRVSYTPDIEDGQVRGYYALVDDISELKIAQEQAAISEKRVRSITDAMPALISYIDTDLRYRFCNSMYTEITGLPVDQVLGKTVAEVFGPRLLDAVGAQMAAALAGERMSFELVPPPELGNRILQYAYIPDVGPDGKVAGFYSMVHDITPHKNTEAALITQQRLLRSVADNLPAMINLMEPDGRIAFANRKHEEWVGRPLDQIVGANIATLLGEEERATHQHYFDKAMAGERSRWGFQRTLHGELRHYQANYIPQNEGERIVGVTCLVNDVTDTKLVEQRLSALARFDALTGLPNRTHLTERIGRAIVRGSRSGHRIALMYLDLDQFKSINDSFGHGGGDLVLVEFGRRLSACVRQTDTVGRLAGDEFVILLEGLNNESECSLVAAKIIKAMERPFDIDGVARIVTTSIGVASCTSSAASVESLLKHADEALYRAKERGRNRYAMTAVT